MAARVRWWKNGDHPNDEVESVFDNDARTMMLTPGKVVKPYVPTEKSGHDPDGLCPECSQAYGVHGKVGRTLVHPGDFIITHDGGTYSVERPVDPAQEVAERIATEEPSDH